MAGFDNDVIFGINCDYTQTDNQNVQESNGLFTNGQIWIGRTAVNAGGTHIDVGTITAGSGITITNGPGTISVAVNGATTGQTITGDTGGALSPVLGNWNILGSNIGPGTTPVATSGSGNTLVVNVQRSQAAAAANVNLNGLSHFDSTSFAVAATGFVTLVGGGFTWNDISGAFSPLKNNGYFITGTATGTLPASPSQGDTIKFFVDHASQLLTIDAPGTQIIRMGSAVTAAGGTAVSTAQGDSVELTYRASDTCWCAIAGFTGSWTVT